MIAVSTFDFVGGLILGTIGGVWLVVDGLLDQRRNRRNRMRGGR